MNFSTENLILLICGIPAIVAGLTVHEFAHAWAADRLGDDTPRRQGRLTLDPLAHLDPFGSLFYVVSALAGFGFGWAKPVLTDPRNLRHPHRDGMLIALAGPISNILQTPFWLAAVFLFGFVSAKLNINTETGLSVASFLSLAIIYGVIINLILAAFNMVPIPPLDGHWVLGALAGEPVRQLYDAIRPYSFILLIILLNFPNPSLFDLILGPVVGYAAQLAQTALGAGVSLAIGN